MYYYLIVLFIVVFVTIYTTKEPPVFTKVKQHYETFRKHITSVPKYKNLSNQILLIGYLYKNHELGYNTNKGYEIGLCLDGTVNQIFHVLLHELAHSTVSEYEHSTLFWQNFKELRKIATDLGIYEAITSSEKFCGKYIQDS